MTLESGCSILECGDGDCHLFCHMPVYWNDAQTHWAKMGGCLATIETAGDNMCLAEVLAINQRGWIGLA